MERAVTVQVSEHLLCLQLKSLTTRSTPPPGEETFTAPPEQGPALAACRTYTGTEWQQQGQPWWPPLPEQRPSQKRSSLAS